MRCWLRRAAGLLFTDQPEKHVTGAWVKIGFFVTDDDLRYQDEVHGNLFGQVEQVLEFLRTKYLKAYITYHGIQRRETFLFPESALRETVLNAIVHKDYSRGIPMQISVYDDRIAVWNPGALPEHWTLKKLFGKHASEPSNPLIANAFFRAGYIEAWGRGIEKINRDCREHGIEPPAYDVDLSGVMVTFRANPAHIRSAGKSFPRSPVGLGEKLGETRVAILAAMRRDATITTKVLAETLGLSTTAVDKNLQYLKTHGYIRRVGPAKGGRWEVAE
ncbi:ATP-binding protein [Candidatus Nitrospira nitrificans]|uniref:ATP-binding protein n=1 Tax=Candidatus Nitrospira nitrificans TaxID=1742973 RepID=UPI000A915A16|nr:ATP-binding protein [Candidatus Nitrospira nitrificans]